MFVHRDVVDRPESLGLDSGRLEKLIEQTAAAIESGGLPGGQVALARDGELALLCTFEGDVAAGGVPPAGNDTLFAAFSTTKAVTSAAAWILIQEGALSLDEPVAEAIPDFARNGKGAVTLHQLLTHTAGFPTAPFDPLDWDDLERRVASFADWRLEWEPGTRFQYHGGSSMWVIAALIECRSGVGFRDFVRDRVARPLGLEHFHVGLSENLNDRVAEIVIVGDPPEPGILEAAGLRLPQEIMGDERGMTRFNRPEIRAVGVPGGGGIFTAGDFALFYQALLRGGRGAGGPQIWQEAMLADALRNHSGELTDPMTGKLANRGLGVVIAGDESRYFRAFAPNNSPRAFGHPGAGGQVAWADPATGISFAFFTNGMDRNPLRMGGRGLGLGNIAVACAAQ